MRNAALSDAVARIRGRAEDAASSDEIRQRLASIQADAAQAPSSSSRQSELLAVARRDAPFYADALAGATGVLTLDRFPVLTKEDLRDRSFDLVTRNEDWLLPRKTYHLMRTSGSSGKPVTTLKVAEEDGYWDAVLEERLYCAYDIPPTLTLFSLSPAQAMGRPLVSGHVTCRPTAKLSLRALNGTSQVVQEYEDIADSVVPDVVRGSPTRILDFIDVCRRKGRQVSSRLVVSSHEQCTEAMRDVMSDFFGCPVVSLYGTTETGLAGWTCASWNVHLHPDVVTHEILTPDASIPTEPGALLLTSLKSSAMPIIRYDTGDLATAAACTCGDVKPAIRLFGRSGGVLQRSDGHTLTPFLLYLILDDLRLWGYQVRQTEAGLATVIVDEAALRGRGASDIERDIEHRLQELCGVGADNLRVCIDTTGQFSIEPSGKKQPLVTTLSKPVDLPPGAESLMSNGTN